MPNPITSQTPIDFLQDVHDKLGGDFSRVGIKEFDTNTGAIIGIKRGAGGTDKSEDRSNSIDSDFQMAVSKQQEGIDATSFAAFKLKFIESMTMDALYWKGFSKIAGHKLTTAVDQLNKASPQASLEDIKQWANSSIRSYASVVSTFTVYFIFIVTEWNFV